MSILNFNVQPAGQSNLLPQKITIQTDSPSSAITTAGFLNPIVEQGFPIFSGDFAFVSYSGGSAIYTASVSSVGVVTLSQYGAGSSGTVTFTSPSIVNHIAAFSNTNGNISQDVSPAINAGNIQAGLSGTAGTVASFPATGISGSLVLAAVANSANVNTTISNHSMGQASVISIPDPVSATANFAIAPAALVSSNIISASGTGGLIQNSGIAQSNVQLKSNIIAATTLNISATPSPTSNAVTVTGLTTSSVVLVRVVSVSNAVTLSSVNLGAGSFTVTMSADPGVSLIISYVAFIAPQ